jgi:Ca-activated chloride channel family protein
MIRFRKIVETAVCALAMVASLGSVAMADQVKLNVALGHPVLKAGGKQITYLKVGLTGFKLERAVDRAPVNVAIVIDTSGSMTGDKILKAKEAAVLAVQRLSSKDIVSVVEYDDSVRVIVPATRLTDTEAVCAAIRKLEADGSTALFAGVSKGSEEVRKFLEKNRVNRVILLSDGIANVGPSSPEELGDLGASLAKEGMSVTTIGLGAGYNEDLMRRLAQKSDGNHWFAENSTDLARIFASELGDVLTVVAKEVTVKIDLGEGIRPVRVLGREAEIAGQRVIASLAQIYSEQEKYVLLEVEVPATAAGRTLSIASVEVAYANLQTKTTDVLTSTVSARFTDSDAECEVAMNNEVLVSAVEQIATRQNEFAMRLRDAGKVDEAKKALLDNGRYLLENAVKLKSGVLDKYAATNKKDAESVEDEKAYSMRRKEMVQDQHARSVQQKK